MGSRPPGGRLPPSFRLKRSIDPFSASDGAVYLLRVGTGEDFFIPDPTESDRAVLAMLAQGFATEEELRARLEAQGLDASTLGTSLFELEKAGLTERRDDRRWLDEAQSERYDRQLIYFSDLSRDGVSAELMQRRLLDSRVVILGCGGLGTWTACGLVCAGVGSLLLIDDDTVEVSNLNRQLLFGEADVGRSKVEAAREALAEHDSRAGIETLELRASGADELREHVRGADLLVSTADWPPHELPRWVNEACLAEGVPYVSAGQFPPMIRVGPMVVPGESACLECLERRTRADYPLYDEVAVFRASHPSPASTIGAASGLIGSIISMEAIHLLTGAVRPASLDRALIIDLRTMRVSPEEVEPDPGCPLCRDRRKAAQPA